MMQVSVLSLRQRRWRPVLRTVQVGPVRAWRRRGRRRIAADAMPMAAEADAAWPRPMPIEADGRPRRCRWPPKPIPMAAEADADGRREPMPDGRRADGRRPRRCRVEADARRRRPDRRSRLRRRRPSSRRHRLPAPGAAPPPAPVAAAPRRPPLPRRPRPCRPALPAGAEPKLVVLRGQKRNVEYPIYEGLNFIGRADEKPVDIDLEDQEPPDRVWCSRQHACINFENDQLSHRRPEQRQRHLRQPGARLPRPEAAAERRTT